MDGIKKINSEEIKKNRKIVLSYIGEKDTKLTKGPKAAGRAGRVSNKVDGIKLNKNFDSKPKSQNEPEKPAPAKSEEAKKQQEKLKLKKKLREEERAAEENRRLEEIKREQEVTRINQEIKLAKLAAAAERKIKRRKALELFRKRLIDKLSEVFSAIKRNFFYGTLYLIVFLIIGYVIFCLLVLRFKINDNIALKMARILPVPAIVADQGIMNYYDFQTMKSDNYNNLSSADKKNHLAKLVILKNLSEKYDLPVNSSEEALAMAFVADENYNQIGLSRIKKISQLLKNVNDLEQFKKYADEYSDAVYYNSDEATKKFGQAVFNLSLNQISDIIFANNGYYIIQIVDNNNGQLDIKYLFVGAKTLDQYVNERLAKIKIFILAN